MPAIGLIRSGRPPVTFFIRPAGPRREPEMDYESPEIIATYVEDELTAEAAVCTR